MKHFNEDINLKISWVLGIAIKLLMTMAGDSKRHSGEKYKNVFSFL